MTEIGNCIKDLWIYWLHVTFPDKVYKAIIGQSIAWI